MVAESNDANTVVLHNLSDGDSALPLLNLNLLIYIG